MIVTPDILAWLAAATFTAAVFQGATGFGFGVLVIPAYLWFLPTTVAIPASVLVGGTMMTVMALTLWRTIPWRMTGRMILGALIGAPAGLWFLSWAPEALIKGLVAIILLGFLGYILWQRRHPQASSGGETAPHPLAEAITGLCGGLMGGGLGMPAPPLLVYFGLRRTAKAVARPAMVAFLWGSLLMIAAMGTAGLGMAETTTSVAAWMLAPVLAGFATGHWLAGRISQRVFDVLTLGALLVTALAMLAQAIG